MTIIFRVNYRTVPGQSLSLHYSSILDEHGTRIDQVVPLQWINHEQWETRVEIHGTGRIRLEYHYQLRVASNGVQLDEWQGPRTAVADPAVQDALLLLDTWCSAGTVDYAFQTKPFHSVLPARGPFVEPALPERANHSFMLRMAAVPPGLVPCLLGGVSEIGDWDWQAAIPLCEVSPDCWRAHLYLPADWHIEYKYGLYDPSLKRAVSLECGENRTLPIRQLGARQWTQVMDEAYRRESSALFRGAGVAIPVFSLRGAHSLGVGEFADLKSLADWAANVGLKLIQILPINDTTSSHDWTDSYPYSAISAFALHPLYLRIDDLDWKMPDDFAIDLNTARDALNALGHVDYVSVMKVKSKLTRRIFSLHHHAIVANASFREFISNNSDWLIPYAVFCVKRDQFGTADFTRWQDFAVFNREAVHALAHPSHADWPDVAYHLWLQFELDRQLAEAVSHLHARGLALKGDLPIGIDRQSVDAWSAPDLFKMDAQAGAPPDAFAVKGQNWGFPTYDWEAMRLDDYAWWRARFARLSRYFDAYRIDHILGFFRIWQIPQDQVEGIMGYFDPALPIHLDEIRERSINFQHARYCRPYIREHGLWELFANRMNEVKERFLVDSGSGCFQLRDFVATQRLIVAHCSQHPEDDWVLHGLLDCASEVLFFEVPGSHGTRFHPRCSMQSTLSFQDLDAHDKSRLEDLYNDYFYRRQEDFWQACGFAKLPAMRHASPMLLCGEDLGMVPGCVPGVLSELGILSLEIQRMPKSNEVEFFNPHHAPYLSVVSPSTHDMPTLRAWWEMDPNTTARFAWLSFGITCPDPELTGEIASNIIRQHLESPAMWTILPLQDLLAMDESIRHPHPHDERINDPAIMPYHWRYRMHLSIDQLAAAAAFNADLTEIIRVTGR